VKRLVLLFALFIILVIVLADAGTLPRYLAPLYDFPNGDKAGHFILYGILAFLTDLALFRSLPSRRPVWVAVMTGLVLASLIGLEEFSQQYFSSRTFDLIDLCSSYLGVFFFSWAALGIKGLETRKR